MMAANKKKINNKATAYIVKIAILSSLSVVLYAFARFPILPAPYNVMDFDFSAIPSLIGGFALGPVAAFAIEAVKVLMKFAIQGSNTAGVGDLSNLIVSVAFVVPASLIYKYKRTKTGAVIGLLIGILTNAIVSSLSNYFLIIPFYASAFHAPYIMDIRVPFAFQYGLLFNLLKTTSAAIVTFVIYKRISFLLNK